MDPGPTEAASYRPSLKTTLNLEKGPGQRRVYSLVKDPYPSSNNLGEGSRFLSKAFLSP